MTEDDRDGRRDVADASGIARTFVLPKLGNWRVRVGKLLLGRASRRLAYDPTRGSETHDHAHHHEHDRAR
jgi:hypothetical protein